MRTFKAARKDAEDAKAAKNNEESFFAFLAFFASLREALLLNQAQA